MLYIQPRVLVPKQCVLIDIFHGNVIHENFSASTKPKICDRKGKKVIEVSERDENWVVTLTEGKKRLREENSEDVVVLVVGGCSGSNGGDNDAGGAADRDGDGGGGGGGGGGGPGPIKCFRTPIHKISNKSA